MLLNRFPLACLLILLSQVALGAPSPRLDKAAPTLCPASPKHKDEWVPTVAQVAALEKSLPAYFAASKAPPSQLPSPEHVYKRHYFGFTKGGKRYIFGSFYPADYLSAVAQAHVGSCPGISDGGNSVWYLEFDLRTHTVTAFGVNGVA